MAGNRVSRPGLPAPDSVCPCTCGRQCVWCGNQCPCPGPVPRPKSAGFHGGVRNRASPSPTRCSGHLSPPGRGKGKGTRSFQGAGCGPPGGSLSPAGRGVRGAAFRRCARRDAGPAPTSHLAEITPGEVGLEHAGIERPAGGAGQQLVGLVERGLFVNVGS